jgi:hypothetical protein
MLARVLTVQARMKSVKAIATIKAPRPRGRFHDQTSGNVMDESKSVEWANGSIDFPFSTH